MISKMQLLCVVKLDTFSGNRYEAQLQCLNRDDAKAFVALMENRSSINGFEVVGYHWKQAARIEEVMGEDGVQKEFKLYNDLFLTVEASDDDQATAMTNLLWDIDSVIK